MNARRIAKQLKALHAQKKGLEVEADNLADKVYDINKHGEVHTRCGTYGINCVIAAGHKEKGEQLLRDFTALETQIEELYDRIMKEADFNPIAFIVLLVDRWRDRFDNHNDESLQHKRYLEDFQQEKHCVKLNKSESSPEWELLPPTNHAGYKQRPELDYIVKSIWATIIIRADWGYIDEGDLIGKVIANPLVRNNRVPYDIIEMRIRKISARKHGYDIDASEVYYTDLVKGRKIMRRNRKMFLPHYVVLSGFLIYTDELLTDLGERGKFKVLREHKAQEKPRKIKAYKKYYTPEQAKELSPALFNECKERIAVHGQHGLEYFTGHIRRVLGADYQVSYRVKTPESLFSKVMKLHSIDKIRAHEKANTCGELFYGDDINGIMIIAPDANGCYEALYRVFAKLLPKYFGGQSNMISAKESLRIIDMIAVPKVNGFQALKVYFPGHLEMQIRSREMHEIAERDEYRR